MFRREFLRWMVIVPVWQGGRHEASPYFEVVSPRPHQVLASNQKILTEWKTNLVQTVDIFISYTNGVSWKRIAENYNASSGTFEFLVGRINSGEVLLQWRSHDDVQEVLASATFELWESYDLDIADFPALFEINVPTPVKYKGFDDWVVTRKDYDRFDV